MGMRSPVLKPVILMDLPVFHRAGWGQAPPCVRGRAAGRTILLHIDNDTTIRPHCWGAAAPAR
jgi:hypothetical protein